MLSSVRNKFNHAYTAIRFYSESAIPEHNRISLVSLFKNYGFTDDQISTLVTTKPLLLTYRPQTLKPKLDFFSSVGLSPSDLHDLFAFYPAFLKSSLENQIKPSYHYLKSMLHTNEDVNFAIKRSVRLLRADLQKHLSPNIEALRECEVPRSRISLLLKTQPRTVMLNHDRFMEIIEETKEMGLNPSNSNFVEAIRVLSGFNKSIREQKKEIYRKWGWSDEEILAAFKMVPSYLVKSDKKIDKTMDFLVNKMGWDSSQVAESPFVILHSLENWTIPRCLVYQFLVSKGLIKEKRLKTFICPQKKVFLKRFVEPYCTQFPELLTIYQPNLVSLQSAEEVEPRGI